MHTRSVAHENGVFHFYPRVGREHGSETFASPPSHTLAHIPPSLTHARPHRRRRRPLPRTSLARAASPRAPRSPASSAPSPSRAWAALSNTSSLVKNAIFPPPALRSAVAVLDLVRRLSRRHDGAATACRLPRASAAGCLPGAAAVGRLPVSAASGDAHITVPLPLLFLPSFLWFRRPPNLAQSAGLARRIWLRWVWIARC